MEMLDRCPRCGGNLIPRNDYIYDIDYYMCLQCGEVIFTDDGLGILRYKFPKERNKESK
jgi:hypothetical protein